MGKRGIETLDDLIQIPADELGLVDIGLMNLLCSEGLPGAESFDIGDGLALMEKWAKRAAIKTDQSRHLIDRFPDLLQGSEPLWRMYCLTTFLWRACHVQFVEEERSIEVDPEWSDSSRHLLFGVLSGNRRGTCASLPVLLVAIARRMGYPMNLVHSPGHVFCRWDGEHNEKPEWRERRNIDFSGDFNSDPDEYYYDHPFPWTTEIRQREQQRATPLYLRSLTPKEELASFFVQRAYVLEAHGQFTAAMDAFTVARNLAPHNDEYAYFAKRCHYDFLSRVLEPWGLNPHRFCKLAEQRIAGNAVRLPWESAASTDRSAIFDLQACYAIELALNSVDKRMRSTQHRSLGNGHNDQQSISCHASESSRVEPVDDVFADNTSLLLT